MLTIILITSLKIIFMYGAMQEGEILFFLRRFFEWCLSKLPIKAEQYLRKPLFDCMFCMSSIWGFTFLVLPMPYILDLILSIAGLNYLWSALVGFLHAGKDVAEEQREDVETLHENIEMLNDKIEYLKRRIFPLEQ